jgi:hypothetical protein
MQNSIFISYNPQSIQEKKLAEGLFKQGRQNGYFIYLPERSRGYNLSTITKSNIDLSDWFIIFSTTQLSDTVMEEITYATTTKKASHIIVVYSQHVGKNIHFPNIKPIEVYIDTYNLNSLEKFKMDILQQIATANKKEADQKQKREEDNNMALKVILGIGAAALLLSALSPSDKN